MASDTPLTDNVQNKHAMQWFGIHAPIDRSMDEANKMREYARDLERVARQMAEALKEFSQCNLTDDNCASLDVANLRIRRLSGAVLAAFQAFEEKYK